MAWDDLSDEEKMLVPNSKRILMGLPLLKEGEEAVLYLKCDDCGEVFNEMEPASDHLQDGDCANTFTIVTEEEAF